MDQLEIEIAEFIFLEIKTRGPLKPIRVANMNQLVIRNFPLNEKYSLAVINGIYSSLKNLGLIEIKTKTINGNTIPPYIILTKPGNRVQSVHEQLIYLEEESDALSKKEAQETEKRELEIENLKLQIIHQKQWFWKVLAGAIIIELVQFYFLFFK